MSWLDFKNLVDNLSLNIQILKDHSKYYKLIAYNGIYPFKTIIKKTDPRNSDQIDFEDNYLEFCNLTSLQPVQVKEQSLDYPFKEKKLPNGKKLYTRIHGVNNPTVAAGQTVNIDLVVPYNWVKFTGAEIFGCELGDIVNFTVHDTVNNDISGLDPQIYGTNLQLNKFGYNVIMPNDRYTNTSDYDADLYQNMTIRCSYTNNGSSSKYIGLNIWLHEVKD